MIYVIAFVMNIMCIILIIIAVYKMLYRFKQIKEKLLINGIDFTFL